MFHQSSLLWSSWLFGGTSVGRNLASFVSAVLRALWVLGWMPGYTRQAPAADDESRNRAPPVAPALEQWVGANGSFVVLTSRARVVIDDERLADEAETFAEELRQITGQRLPVAADGRPRSGDLVLSLNNEESPEHREGYRLNIASKVTIASREQVGISRGTQTVDQLFALDRRKLAIPRGRATDWPRLDERGFMIDAGRKYWQPSYIEQQIRIAAWYKLNTVHLHFTESFRAFRICRSSVSGQYNCSTRFILIMWLPLTYHCPLACGVS